MLFRFSAILIKVKLRRWFQWQVGMEELDNKWTSDLFAGILVAKYKGESDADRDIADAYEAISLCCLACVCGWGAMIS